MKKYIALVPTRDENSICLETGYSLGGVNWYNGDSERRGYYLYCTPIQIDTKSLPDGREYQTFTQVLGKGNKLLLKEVSRQSNKAAEEAERIAEEKADWLLHQVVTRYGLILADSKES
ncbi:MAG: hypothetical protein IJ341_01760 [Bacteroidales bacterium]|nr:hypothetical protein [Bacteroidales bacterium]